MLTDYSPIVLISFQEAANPPTDVGSLGLTFDIVVTGANQTGFLPGDVGGKSALIDGVDGGLRSTEDWVDQTEVSWLFPIKIGVGAMSNALPILFASYQTGIGSGGGLIYIVPGFFGLNPGFGSPVSVAYDWVEGQPYVLGVSWNGVTGATKFYVNGQQVGTTQTTSTGTWVGTHFWWGCGFGNGYGLNNKAAYYMICDSVLADADFADIFTTLVGTGDTYGLDNSAGWAKTGYPARVTITPTGFVTGNIVLTPSGCGLSTPQTLTLADVWQVGIKQFLPLTTGVLTITGTNTAGLTDPAPLELTITSLAAHGVSLFPLRMPITNTTAISFDGSHPSNVGDDPDTGLPKAPVVLKFYFDNLVTLFATETAPRINTFWKNESARGVKYAGLPYYTLDLDPSDDVTFPTSGTYSLAWTITALDGSVTRMPDEVIFVNKGDVIGESHNAASGTFDTAVGLFTSTDHATLTLTGDIQSWTSSATVTQNTDGYFRVEMTGRTISDNGGGDNDGKSPFPNLTWLKGGQLGNGGTTPPLVTIRGATAFGSYFVLEEALIQGPLEGAPYFGINWSNTPDTELVLSAGVFAYNCSYIGVGEPHSEDKVVGCRTNHSVWGHRCRAMVMVDLENITKPAHDDCLPAPKDVHDDRFFQFTGDPEVHPEAWFSDVYSDDGGGTRGFVMAGDGIIGHRVTMRRCRIGNYADSALAVMSPLTILEEIYVKGVFHWSGTELPFRAHDAVFLQSATTPYEPDGGFITYTPGGRFSTPFVDTDGALNCIVAKSPDDTIVIDKTKLALTDAVATITDATYSNGVVAITTDVPIYAGETPTLVDAGGALTINGVPSAARSVPVWRNKSAETAEAGELTAPTLNVQSVAASSVTLNWDSATGGTPPYSYAIYKSLDNVAFTLAVPGATSPATVTGLAEGTVYYFAIGVHDSSPGPAFVAPEGSATAATTCAAPTLIIGHGSDASIIASWAAVVGAVTYKVYLDGVLAATIAAPTLTATLTGLTNDQIYAVTVTATGVNSQESTASLATDIQAGVPAVSAVDDDEILLALGLLV